MSKRGSTGVDVRMPVAVIRSMTIDLPPLPGRFQLQQERHLFEEAKEVCKRRMARWTRKGRISIRNARWSSDLPAFAPPPHQFSC